MKKQIRNISYIIILLLSFSNTNAQSLKSKRYELFGGLGAVNFNGDIGAIADREPVIWVKLFETVAPTGNIGLRYKFDERHSATSSLFIGQMYAKDHAKGGYPTRGMSFTSFYTELSGRYEFNVIKEKKKRTVYRQFGESGIKNFNLPTYLFVGLGGVLNTGSLSEEDGRILTTESYTNFAPLLCYGVGVKYKITRTSYIGAELNVRLAINDKVDNAWKSSETGNKYGSWFDGYQSITINYIQQIRSNRNGTPNFRRRGSSSNNKNKSSSRSRRR